MKTCPSCHAVYPNHFAAWLRDATPLPEAGGWPEGALVRRKYRIVSKVGQGGIGALRTVAPGCAGMTGTGRAGAHARKRAERVFAARLAARRMAIRREIPQHKGGQSDPAEGLLSPRLHAISLQLATSETGDSEVELLVIWNPSCAWTTRYAGHREL
jgi:hypothetical protein